MMKKRITRITPLLLNINFLVGMFLICSAGPAYGQAMFQADILETGDPARKFLISQQIGEIEDYWIVDIDIAALDSLVQSQGNNINFQFEVGAQFQWNLNLAEGFTATVAGDTLWTKYLGEAETITLILAP